MKRILTTIFAAVLATAPAFGAGGLPYDTLTVSCEEIIAKQDINQATKLQAASLYAHGMHMGNRCIKRDYVKAFEIFIKYGRINAANSILNDIEARARQGNPSAQS